MDYSSFSSLDFVMDDYFKKWILKPDEGNTAFWENWMKQHPEKRTDVEEAIKIINRVHFREYLPSSEVVIKDWEKLQEELKSERVIENHDHFNHKKRSVNYFYKTAAALLALVFFAGLVYYILEIDNQTLDTKYGETKEFTLPDNSIVTLNSNSHIRMSEDWGSNKAREVWLEGEGYFTVTHQSNNQKFIVHTCQLDIEVLGTEFNVNARRGTTKVVLNKGKVKVNTEDSQELFMEPGELISFSEKDQRLVRSVVKPDVYSGWKDHLLTFSDVPLSEIAKLVEDNYGLRISFENKEINSKKFTGSIPSEDINVLITSIAEAFNLKVTKNMDKVKFSIKRN